MVWWSGLVEALGVAGYGWLVRQSGKRSAPGGLVVWTGGGTGRRWVWVAGGTDGR